MSHNFSGKETGWQQTLGNLRDVVRQELVSQHIAWHMPDAAGRRVLDVGCGQGTQAIQLASRGAEVLAVDPSEVMIKSARKNANGMDNPPTFVRGTLEDLPFTSGASFEMVCCHGVLMYLSELRPAVRRLVERVSSGGLISVLTRNRLNLAFRAGMMGQWEQVPSLIDARFYDNRIGVEGARADEPHEVAAALSRCGAMVLGQYGVRLFTDHLPDIEPPADTDKIVEAELLASQHSPYVQVAALTHTIAQRID